MATVRVEELVSRPLMGLLPTPITIAAIGKIGINNKETTPSGTSQIAFGPAANDMDVYVRNFGGQIYFTKGRNTPVAVAANSTLLSDKEYVPVHLDAGESIAVITASVS